MARDRNGFNRFDWLLVGLMLCIPIGAVCVLIGGIGYYILKLVGLL